ncbi:tryptophan 7-halogenase [Streptomyces kunmingensis]|uniref:Tryptophan 7-halogenase n=1 Tax=Streptomyces kunmingensis TaxID=68225 RepID=A0ABU6C251_9ACTN|nr:FAD-dependent monooxygenase [Streptomyces kunmingensis]MEB3958784.1 tryptophan 7-halogenase [Streptomyces kunmingensis]
MTVHHSGPPPATAAVYDVVVAGGGPAGVAAALTLGRGGRTVLLADAGGGPPPVGEALPAAARVLLHDLGARDILDDRHHLPCHANLSAWGSDVLAAQDAILDPHGHGWHLDRGRFDRGLRERARLLGTDVAEHSTVRPAHRSGDGTWTVELRGPRERRTVRCRWLVDATGRRASLATAAGARRIVHDRLIALCLTLPPSTTSIPDTSTLVESSPDGWWYTALLPAGHRLLVRYTDADLPGARTDRAGLRADVARARHTDARVSAHPWPTAAVRRAPAHTVRLNAVHGSGWVAAGDAAAAFDPLSSQGILIALYTGMRAGHAVHDHLDGDRTALPRYAAELDTITAVHLRNRRTFYALEHRWPRHSFWHRRHTAGPTDSADGRPRTRPDPMPIGTEPESHGCLSGTGRLSVGTSPSWPSPWSAFDLCQVSASRS